MMRFMSFERDNTTRFSQPDHRGNCYMASFELYPFHEGANYTCYKGVLNGEGNRHGDFCAVKAMRNSSGKASDWLKYKARATEAQRVAVEFNKFMGYRAVSFEIPTLTRIQAVSDFTGVFRFFCPHKKRLVQNEYVVLEELLEDDFQKFPNWNNSKDMIALADGNVAGYANPASDVVDAAAVEGANDNNRESDDALLQAFIHFSWLESRQTKIVCDLQGAKDPYQRRCSYDLISPTIHSTERLYGDTDRGPYAVLEIIASHQCNSFCELIRSAQQRNLPSKLFTGASRG